MAEADSAKGLFLILAILLILVWKVGGSLGLDYLLPKLTPA